VTAAGRAAHPDATVRRVETDVDGAAYEAHMATADGSPLAVSFDESVNVAGTVDRPAGHCWATRWLDRPVGTSETGRSMGKAADDLA
jgi:hypothetical protein